MPLTPEETEANAKRAAEQEAEMERRAAEQANERVERRERLGHDEQDEPLATTTPEEARAKREAEMTKAGYSQDEIDKQTGANPTQSSANEPSPSTEGTSSSSPS